MSLAALNTESKADAGVEIDILNPKTNIPTGVKITILGADSATFIELQRKQQNHRMENMKNRRGPTISAEELEVESTALLVACTKGWRTVTQEEYDLEGGEKAKRDVSRAEIEIASGEWVSFSPENATRLYNTRGFKFLREQIDREMGDRSNFLKA